MEESPTLGDVGALALVLGIAGGTLELLLLLSDISAASEGRLMLGAHLAWMPAVAMAVLLLLAGGLAWAVGRAWRWLGSWRALTGLLAGLAVLSGLRLLDNLLGVWTVNLVAAGIAVRAGQGLGPWLAARRRHLHRTAWGGALLVAAIAGGVIWRDRRNEARALAALPAAQAGRPNVLLLVLDTVRAMNLSVYGYARRTSPELERLAARGVVFDRAIATAPWTRPSHASMMTGRWEHELTADHLVPLDARYPTVAETLDRLGYRTGGFVANLTHTTPAAGIARGFGHYEAHLVSLPQVLVSAKLPGQLYKALPFGGWLPEARINYVRKTAADINRALLAWVDQGGDRPFFAFANYMDAHDPYRPQPPFDTLFASPTYGPMLPTRADGPGLDRPREMRPYDQAIASLDHDLGQLFAGLAARGLLERTIVIVTADHGEAFGEHGIYGHGSTLYLPMLQVPLLVAGPGVPAGLRVPAWVSLQALAPTIMALAAPDAPQPFPAAPLSHAWGAPDPAADTLYAGSRFAANNPPWYPTSKGTLHGLLAGNDLLVREADGRRELYDLATDPLTSSDLIGTPTGMARADALGAVLTAQVGPARLHTGYRPAR
ncbi:MAG: sulfatase [Gemmatimonadetes bacterium]|nr:sulfatase [Gemmatimonadota bacterium]MBK6778031.1 sulfatase [Gemmatimonadota bacterium]MBK9692269.1 sulfatase [Gemmatimonadota bacterium]